MAGVHDSYDMILKAYAAGERGTRSTIESLGQRDYADLIIALGQSNLALPRPRSTPARTEALARAQTILQPRLRHGA